MQMNLQFIVMLVEALSVIGYCWSVIVGVSWQSGLARWIYVPMAESSECGFDCGYM